MSAIDLTTLAAVEPFLNLGAGNSDEALLSSLITAASQAGCPPLVPAQGSALRGLLDEQAQGNNTHAPCNGSDVDCFKRLDVMAIVVQVDKTLLNQGNQTIVGVWASTHAAP